MVSHKSRLCYDKICQSLPADNFKNIFKRLYQTKFSCYNMWCQNTVMLFTRKSASEGVANDMSLLLGVLPGYMQKPAGFTHSKQPQDSVGSACSWGGKTMREFSIYRQISNISHTKSQTFLISSCSCLCPIQLSQVLSWKWRCSWSSADRRCSNYIWVINNFISC